MGAFDDVIAVAARIRASAVRYRGDNAYIQCIFHADRNPSLGIRRDNGAYGCFSCPAKGSGHQLIDYLVDNGHMGKDDFAIPSEIQEKLQPPWKPDARRHRGVFVDLCQTYEAYWDTDDAEPARQYLESRRLTVAAFHACGVRLGYVPHHRVARESVPESKLDLLVELGMVRKVEDSYSDVFIGRIVTWSAKHMWAQARKIPNDVPDITSTYLNTLGTKPVLNWPVPAHIKEYAIVEGLYDAASLVTYGWYVVSIMGGLHKDRLSMFKKDALSGRAVPCFDRDLRGQEYTAMVGSTTLTVFDFGGYNDPNEAHRHGVLRWT